MTHSPDNRRHRRCPGEAPIAYAFLNRTRWYGGMTRNLSPAGMYFEGARSLPIGAFIVIRTTVGAGTGTPAAPPAEAPGPGSRGCAKPKALVTAQVKHCRRLGAGPSRFGVGVHYTAPAV